MHASRSRLIGAALSLLLAATLAGCSTAESGALAEPAGAPGHAPASAADDRGLAEAVRGADPRLHNSC